MTIDPVYTTLDAFLQRFVTHISIVKSARPINLLSEKRKFFDSRFSYNPQFEYRPLKANLGIYRQKINALLATIPKSDIGNLYQKRFQECLLILDLIESIGQNSLDFTDLSIKLYGKPLDKYIKEAHKIIALPRPPRDTSPLLNLQQIITETAKFLDNYNLNYPIVIRKNSKNNFSITRNGKILIPHHIRRKSNNLECSLEHEIGTHLLRFHNGTHQKYGIFQWGTAGYFKDEEGLAIIKSHLNSPHFPLRKAALSLVAIHYSLNHSFSQTFQYLYTLSRNQNTCWNLALRSKRGLKDTSDHAAFTKDLYFQWVYQLTPRILADPQILDYAWNGKASLEELKQFTSPNPDLNLTINFPNLIK